jgi:transposase
MMLRLLNPLSMMKRKRSMGKLTKKSKKQSNSAKTSSARLPQEPRLKDVQ